MRIIPVRNTFLSQLQVSLSALTLAILSFAVLPAKAQPAQSSKTTPKTAQAQAVTNNAPDSGERKFQANCARCHNPPEQLSPRIVGTVVRHMRVRATLSAEDERDILRYLAP